MVSHWMNHCLRELTILAFHMVEGVSLGFDKDVSFRHILGHTSG
jgi:hypothetical protein